MVPPPTLDALRLAHVPDFSSSLVDDDVDPDKRLGGILNDQRLGLRSGLLGGLLRRHCAWVGGCVVFCLFRPRRPTGGRGPLGFLNSFLNSFLNYSDPKFYADIMLSFSDCGGVGHSGAKDPRIRSAALPIPLCVAPPENASF